MITKPSHPFRSLSFATARPVLLATGLALVASLAFAQDRDPARLGSELTPAGAEKAGTPSGIPAWSPPEAMGPNWTAGKRRMDFFRFKSDKPLYTIDASNADKYADKLDPGHLALLKELKGYRMDVYPTRRTCGMPDFVAENTKKNVNFAKLTPDGFALDDAYVPGIPFPLPQNGAEVMWNSKMRYRGEGLEYRNMNTTVSPRRGGSEWIKLQADTYIYLPSGSKTSTTFAKAGKAEGYLWFGYTSPAAMAGQAATFSNVAGKPMETFYYFPGQRRVRRMPAYAYDAPQIGFENEYAADEPYVFSGSLDRFDWKLVGKREMIVPYNSLGMHDFTAKFEDVMLSDFVAPSHRRYELHRVWVVEATVRPGMRHLSPKRTFYVDEDSWNLVAAVDYDAQGKLWKLREGHVIPVYETGTCDAIAFIQHNLLDGRYVMDGSTIAAGSDISWMVNGSGKPYMKPDFYSAENLRALSER